LVYGLGAYAENRRNPEALLYRVSVHLGHRRLVASVYALGSTDCRHACLPNHPMHELAPLLDGIRAGRPVDRSVIVGYYVAPQAFDEPVFTREREQMIRAIGQRFTMELESPADAKYVRFRLGADA